MKSLKVEGKRGQQTYICVHWRSFPPLGAGATDIEKLRAEQAIQDDEYNRYLIWKRACGLLEMAEAKCLSCPHRRRVEWRTTGPVLVDPEGVVTPIVDGTDGEASSQNRHFAAIFQRPGTRGSHTTAAWLARGEDEGHG